MYKFTSLFMLALGALTSVNAATNVTDIKNCPTLTPRATPTSVHDLRIDDIRIVGALGDSITAGFAMLGFNTSEPPLVATLQADTEFRGLSYSIGGDNDSFTIPNYVRHYQPSVTGFSISEHPAEHCNGDSCVAAYIPNEDFLNAAQSGAIAKNLDHEVNYLIARLKTLEGIDYEKDWKMINIQIGSNDMCGACNSTYMADVTPERYGHYVDAAIAKIQAHVPRVLINLLGVFRVSEVFPLSASNQDYCREMSNNVNTILNRHECSCGDFPGGLEIMDNLTNAYNEKLVGIYNKYQKQANKEFTVVYQQANLNISSFPIEFFSNFDCFHPSLLGHQFVSKLVWNELFSPQALKPRIFNWNSNETLYCPVDSDRIATK